MAGGNDSYTKILLHCDGADGSTTFTDTNIGGSSHTWTANGNAQVDTATSKFGGACGMFDGTGDWIDTPDSTDFTLGSGDFTLDFWFNINGGGGTSRYICGQCDSAFTASTFSFGARMTASDTVSLQVCSGSTFTSVTSTSTFLGGWNHFAGVRTGNTLKLFINGTQQGGDVAFSSVINDSANKLSIGRPGETASSYFTGWVEEFRLSVGTARWTANFTAPTVAYDGIFESVGAAFGAGLAAGVGAATVAAAGTASGSASASAVGESTVAAAGTASGSADAQAVGTAVTPAVGLASGTSSALGAITGIHSAEGLAAGTSSVNGVSIILPIISTKALQMPVDYVLAAQQSESRGRSPLTKPGRADYRSLRAIFRE